jgi:hypothetical protein
MTNSIVDKKVAKKDSFENALVTINGVKFVAFELKQNPNHKIITQFGDWVMMQLVKYHKVNVLFSIENRTTYNLPFCNFVEFFLDIFGTEFNNKFRVIDVVIDYGSSSNEVLYSINTEFEGLPYFFTTNHIISTNKPQSVKVYFGHEHSDLKTIYWYYDPLLSCDYASWHKVYHDCEPLGFYTPRYLPEFEIKH